jgi:hypothetical protein
VRLVGMLAWMVSEKASQSSGSGFGDKDENDEGARHRVAAAGRTTSGLYSTVKA